MSETPAGKHGHDSTGHASAHPAPLPFLDHGTGGHDEEHGEGNWLVSYADMMTLLVGFFVILLSFANVDAGKFDEAKKSITAQFGGVYQVPYGDLADRIKEAVKKLGIGDQLVMKTSDAGLEISFRGTVFFDLGSVDLKAEAKPILDSLISAMKQEKDPLDVTVEGHTDDVPISNGKLFRNNWELSSLRACRVLESFLDAGLPQERLTALGYGEARPLVANRDSRGVAIPENQAQNRRVIIRVVRRSEPAIPKLEKDAANQPNKSPEPAAPLPETPPDEAASEP